MLCEAQINEIKEKLLKKLCRWKARASSVCHKQHDIHSN